MIVSVWVDYKICDIRIFDFFLNLQDAVTKKIVGLYVCSKDQVLHMIVIN